MANKDKGSPSHQDEEITRQRINAALDASKKVWDTELDTGARRITTVVRFGVRLGIAALGGLAYYAFASSGRWTMAAVSAGVTVLVLGVSVAARRNIRD